MAEIITVERRRRWSDADKRQIVEETLAPGSSVSAVAKRHGLHPGQVFDWRRQRREGGLGGGLPSGFAPVVVAAQHSAEPAQSSASHGTGRIEIVLGRGRRITVEGVVDAVLLRGVINALARR